MARTVPDLRRRVANGAPVRPGGRFVLYWMIAARRARWNFALDRAVELARELGRPLVVLEPLRCGHRWASARVHRFVLDGMRDNAAAFGRAGVLYHPYVEPADGDGRGLVDALARDACAVVTDEFPSFFLPRMVAAAAERMSVLCEVVDSNGLLPLRATEREFARAFDMRRFLQRELPAHLRDAPRAEPFRRAELRPLDSLPRTVTRTWPRATAALLEPGAPLDELPLDHEVAPVPFAGGAREGGRVLRRFVEERLGGYAELRNQPDVEGASGLSPYLHFGHVSAHQVLAALAAREGWSAETLIAGGRGARSGWWGMSAAAESFLDELVTWRELGYVFAHHRPDHDRYASLPAWARETLAEHASDRRPQLYDRRAFENAETHDELWNAAQNQLRVEGRIHNYLRMLWGKKILHWSPSPEAALEVMVELNNRWAIDGRDPNSYSGIFWVLGRFDRAWGPERDVFGKIRYMSSDNTRRKLRLGRFLERWDG